MNNRLFLSTLSLFLGVISLALSFQLLSLHPIVQSFLATNSVVHWLKDKGVPLDEKAGVRQLTCFKKHRAYDDTPCTIYSNGIPTYLECDSQVLHYLIQSNTCKDVSKKYQVKI